MISEASKTLFSEIFIYLARGEKKLEVIRQVLCDINEFEPYTAFKRISSSNNKNFLTSQDLVHFLNENDIFFPEEIISDTFLSHYDYDSDGKLCYAEFLRSILPGDHPVLRTEVSQRPIGTLLENGRLRDSVEYTLAKLLNEEIIFYLESEPQKRLLYEIDNFSYALLFSTIDREDSGFIDFNNLNGFFESQGIYPYEEEVISILRRLDRDDDGRITLQEFKNGLTPKNFTGVSDLPILYCPKVLSSPKQKQRSNEKRLLSPSKNYPFEAIRRPNSPNQKANLNNSHYKERVFSPVKNGNSNLVSILKSGSKKRDEEKSIIDLKKEIKRDLSISKKINSPNRKRTPEKKNNFKSFHEQNEKRKNATDSKMNSRPLKTILKSPLPKKVTHFDSMKKNLEKEMEFSKKINHSFHKKSESFMSSLNAMSMKISPKKSPRLELKKDMNELASYFKKIIALEREVERIKQDLALRPDFNLMDFFSMFDKNEKGYINQTEIKNFLDSLGINPNDEHFSLFLKRFDRNNFGRFKFCDFVEIFTPSQTDYADLLKQRKPVGYENKYSIPSEMLSKETRRVIFELLQRTVENEKEIEGERKILIKLIGNELREIFERIDLNKNGVLSLKEMKVFLEAHETYITERDATNLFNRFDHYKKATISYAEFIQELQHKL